MGKVEVSALIKAIQESVSLLVSDGLAARPKIADPVVDATYVEDLESGYSTEIDDIIDNIPDVPPTPPTPQPVVVYIQSGNLYYQSSVKNDTSKSDSRCYAIYADEARQTPYVFDWGKRNVFGNVVNGEFIPAAVQTQAQLPSTTGANTWYALCVNKRSSTDGRLWLARNSYQDGYAIFSSPRYLMIYDDAISFWFNEDHSNKADPTYIDWNTGIDYDSSKTYKVLALVNSDGIKVDDEYLYSTTFTEQNGKLIIRITYSTSAFEPAARIVFYAKEKTVYIGYFNAGNGNAQKEAVVSWGPGGDQYEYVYPLNSDTAYQFNASEKYTIISVFYKSGETVTNETLAPYSISGSVTMINDPGDSGKLMLKTKMNNRIYGKPCGCTFTAE